MCVFSDAQPGPRSAVLAHRPDLLPQSADLSRLPTSKTRVLPIFHYALRPGGFLFLGDGRERVAAHRSVQPAGQEASDLPAARSRSRAPSAPVAVRAAADAARRQPARARDRGRARRCAGPPKRVCSSASRRPMSWSNGEATWSTTPRGTGDYLEAPPGQPSRHLLSLARKGLRLDLRAALQQAMETRQLATRERVPLEVGRDIQAGRHRRRAAARPRRRAVVPGSVRRCRPDR